QVFNPPGHWVATANHNILPSGYRHAIGYEWSPPYRFLRIRQRLDVKEKFSLDDFKSMQHDNTSIPGQTLARLAKTTAVHDPALKPVVELLAGWDGVLSRESKAGPLYAVWLQELLAAFYSPHVPKQFRGFVTARHGVVVMLAALEKPDEFWFGKNPVAGR